MSGDGGGASRGSRDPRGRLCEAGRLRAKRPLAPEPRVPGLSLPSSCRYRYTLDDLYPMMNALKRRAESYNEWALNVNEALEAKVNKKRSTWCGRRDGLGEGGRS